MSGTYKCVEREHLTPHDKLYFHLKLTCRERDENKYRDKKKHINLGQKNRKKKKERKSLSVFTHHRKKYNKNKKL